MTISQWNVWGNTVTLTSLVLSIFVNALVSGLIVFRILKVFLEVNRTQVDRTSVERTLASTGDTALRHVIFVIIESGVALLVVQLVRTIIGNVNVQPGTTEYSNITAAFYMVSGINEMFNVIIRSVRFYFFFVLLITFVSLGYHANNNFGAGFNAAILR